jgi:hypothetical protein
MDPMYDRKVIENIREYIIKNNLSVKKIGDETGIGYHRLWSILDRSKSIKLSDYVSICNACCEPMDYFLPEKGV